MGRPRLNPIGAAPAPIGDATPGENPAVGGDLDGYVVAPGRTLTVDRGKTLRPGDSVSLEDDEVQRLLALGFIIPAASPAADGGGVSVGALKVIGGRPPGGVVV